MTSSLSSASTGYFGNLRLLLQGSEIQLGIALALSATSAMLDLASMVLLPAFVGLALQGGGLHPASPVLIATGEHSRILLTSGVLVLFSARVALSLLLGGYLAHLSQSVRARVADRLMRNYLLAHYEESLGRSTSEMMTSVISHASHFASSVVLPLLRLVVDAVTIVTLLIFLAWIAPKLTCLAALVLGVTIIGYAKLVRKSSEKHSARLVHLEGVLTEQVSQALHGAREVRVFRLQDYFLGEINTVLNGLAHAQARLGAIYWFPRALGEFLLIMMAIAYMSIMSFRGHPETVVLSNLGALAFAGLRLLPAFAQCMVGLSTLRAGRSVTAQLAQNLSGAVDAPQQHTQPLAYHAETAFETLELVDVSYGYLDDKLVLNGIHLKIARGQSIGVIGLSGSGKSTLGDVMLGLLKPRSGKILVNGDSADLCQPWWWSRVGFVPQNPYIANDSLARNIAYGVSDADIDHERLWAALTLAQLESMVKSWPVGTETKLGDQGMRLSGGQRQRVAIARALYRQRELLVLDEATSALDAQTEAEVIQALNALHGKVTTLVIAHRLTTLENCDSIIEIQAGKAMAQQDRTARLPH